MFKKTWLLASGSNGSGQLGIGHVEDVSTYTYCRFSSGLPEDLETGGSTDPMGRIIAVASGAGHSLLLMMDRHMTLDENSTGFDGMSLWATGTNQYDQLGPAYPSGNAEPANNSWTKIDYMSYIEAAGLPIGPHDRYSPVKIACSWSTSFICLRHWKQLGRDESWSEVSEKVISFGSNDFGELGAGIERDSASSSDEEEYRVHLVDLPEGQHPAERLSIHEMKASHRNIVCLCRWHTENEVEDVVYGWGAGRHGQLDVRTAVIAREQIDWEMPIRTRSRPATESTSSGGGSTRTSGGVRLRKSTYPLSYSSPIEVDVASVLDDKIGHRDPLGDLDGLAVGAGHILFRWHEWLGDNIMIGLGSNVKNQLAIHLADPNDEDPICPISRWAQTACTWNGTFTTENGGRRIWSTGTNTHGQLGQGDIEAGDQAIAPITPGLRKVVEFPHGNDVIKLVCGSEHVIVTTQGYPGDKKVWTWGWNEHGNLGLGAGDVRDRWQPVEVPLDANHAVKDVWAGCGTSWLLVESSVDV